MILTIDVTVTGPDWVASGSAAVTVNPAPLQDAPAAAADLAQQRSQVMRWGVNRA